MTFVFFSTAIVMLLILKANTFGHKHRRILHKSAKTNSLRFTLSMTASVSMRDISSQIKEARKAMTADANTAMIVDALRGKNLNDDDRQGVGIDMKVVEMSAAQSETDVLPTIYDPIKLESYFSKRPTAVATRLWQIVSTSSTFLLSVTFDFLTGRTKDIEVKRAAELRNTIVSLGPFFIKLGQALSIRPDILSPRAMVELQQLCDKVPCYDNALAMETIRKELGRPATEIFSKITTDPVAAASLGQVYRATLRSTGEEVAVKVQRPFVLETVSLDLYLIRKLGLIVRNFPSISSRLDLVGLLDEFAGNFYQELDYNLECRNGIKIAEDMKVLPKVVIPKCYPDYTARRVHVAEWVDGEKLSQSTADDVGALVNLGVITYLTQLLDTGFFHADPHPGNMLRTPDGRLVILDFGLMTTITDNQKYGMIEAIAHLIHRDYSEIGQDFINLDFIPVGVDTRPIVPALARVFEAALAGGGAKSINFQELAADLAEITFKFPFRIPPYFALIIRAISVLEGIALVGNPEFAIVDEAYPFISKILMTDDSPRLKAAFRYMVYGKSKTFDVDRIIDMLQAFEKFVAIKESGDGSAFKVGGKRGDVYVGKAGDATGTKKLDPKALDTNLNSEMAIEKSFTGSRNSPSPTSSSESARQALKFFFSNEGQFFRDLIIDEISNGIDALSRDIVQEVLFRVTGMKRQSLPFFIRTVLPPLTPADQKVVESMAKLIKFLLNDFSVASSGSSLTTESNNNIQELLSLSRRQITRENINRLLPLLREFSPNIRSFGLIILNKLIEKSASRVLRASADAVFGPVTQSGMETGTTSSSISEPKKAFAAA